MQYIIHKSLLLSTLVVLDFGIEVEETPKKGLRALLEKDLHTDVTFIVEGSPVPAHRVIVASQSEYFDHLLYGRMKESKASTITLEDTHLEAFRLLLMYMYTGSVRTLDMQVKVDAEFVKPGTSSHA